MTIGNNDDDGEFIELKPRITDPERPRLSASSISTFRQCPRQWYIKYMVGLPQPVGFEAKVGNFIHDIFEDIYEMDPEDRTPEAAREMAASRWEEFYDEVFNELSDAGIMVPEEQYLKGYTWDRTHTLWEIETPKEIELISAEMQIDTDVEGVHLYGFIDRLEAEEVGVVISDYKTGKMGKDGYIADKINQILLYCLGYLYQEGEKAALGRLIFLRDGIVEVEFTEEVIDETLKFLIRNNKRIKETVAGSLADAKAKTGPLCEWCSFIDLCPEGQAQFAKRRSEGRSRSDAPAYRILGIDP